MRNHVLYGVASSRRVLLLALLPLWSAAAAGSQELLTAADLRSLTAPAPDHRIAYGEGPLQFGHLRLPDGQGPHPVVIYLHGGCWLSQWDIAHAAPLEQALAGAGYAVWSLEYRRVGDEGGGWPGTFLDVGRGADHLRILSGRFPLDLERVIAVGHSAGGHLALWLAARRDLPRESEIAIADPLPIDGVLALAPAADLEALHEAGVCGGVVDRLVGGSPAEVPERYAAVSPMRLAPIDVPQRLVIGVHDEGWRRAGETYARRAAAAGDDDLVVREAADSGHFEMIVPTTSTWSLVLDELGALASGLRPAADGQR